MNELNINDLVGNGVSRNYPTLSRLRYFKNKRIQVDWHGPADYDRDFVDIPPAEIDIYIYASNNTGPASCGAGCSHCYLKALPPYRLAMQDAWLLAGCLTDRVKRSSGAYNVSIVTPDSFSVDHQDDVTAGSAYRIAALGTIAWTSGITLAGEEYNHRLTGAWQQGHRTIMMNGHAVAGVPVPFVGVASPEQIKAAIQNIRKWGCGSRAIGNFNVGLCFTLRSDNCSLEQMRKMVIFCELNKLDFVRFNAFANFTCNPGYDQFEMSQNDIAQVYENLRVLHREFIGSSLQMAVSEDLGEFGIEAIADIIPEQYRNQQVGRCRAGWRLFAICVKDGELVVTACVDRFAPVLGKVVRTWVSDYDIAWDIDAINRLRDARLTPGATYGCFGGIGYRWNKIPL